MDNLRWILIISGVAILVLLWFSGRAGRRERSVSRAPDPLLGDAPVDAFDERLDGLDEVTFDSDFDDFADIDPAHEAPARGASAGPSSPVAPSARPAPSRAPAPSSPAPRGSAAARAPSDALGFEAPGAGGFGGLAQKFEAIGARLAPKRRQRVAASEPSEEPAGEPPQASKIVTLHVVAPEGEILPPDALYAMFERRGYHHGDMSIFHSMYEGRTVFSIARMIKPGTFDLDDPASFETPGLALILQLPGPVAADTAFEVMLSESFEIAAELGGTVLDGNRSTLGRQTEQHLREGIYEYMHRQKYVDSVAS